jgi:hypothetical protein
VRAARSIPAPSVFCAPAWFAVFFTLFAVNVSAAASAQSSGNPLEGRWVLDVGRSHYGGGAEPRRSETMTCRAHGDGVNCTIESVRQDGRKIVGRFDAPYDGTPRPATGIPDIDQVALRRLDAHIADATFSFHGRPVFGYRAVRSKDGRTLTVIAVDPTTRVVHESVVVYVRK